MALFPHLGTTLRASPSLECPIGSGKYLVRTASQFSFLPLPSIGVNPKNKFLINVLCTNLHLRVTSKRTQPATHKQQMFLAKIMELGSCTNTYTLSALFSCSLMTDNAYLYKTGPFTFM